MQYPKEVLEPVREVLRGDDGQWIHHCLTFLVTELPNECQMELRTEIERVAWNPTTEERKCECEKIAKEVLKGFAVADEQMDGHLDKTDVSSIAGSGLRF